MIDDKPIDGFAAGKASQQLKSEPLIAEMLELLKTVYYSDALDGREEDLDCQIKELLDRFDQNGELGV